jgi:hypothetical protein
MPILLRLHDAGFRTWPFESASFAARPRPLLLEIYTRLMTGPVAKSNPAARKLYLATRRRSDPLYSAINRAVLDKAEASEDAFDALVSTLEMVRRRNPHAPRHPQSHTPARRRDLATRRSLGFAPATRSIL